MPSRFGIIQLGLRSGGRVRDVIAIHDRETDEVSHLYWADSPGAQRNTCREARALNAEPDNREYYPWDTYADGIITSDRI